jgi:EAL domain-containing protein (putative c-di-GMP-specific phosphodiesterase class I)
LADGGVRSVFQPIVDLRSGEVVAYEALSRGPQGPLETPNALFGAARQAGRLAQLDDACRRSAFVSAAAAGLVSPLAVFVNVEPEVLDSAPLDELMGIAESVPGGLRVVLEITERALASRPAELLRTVTRVRELGWGVALDDVGAEASALAFMALLRPDVVKLDLSLIQGRPNQATAEVMHAVNAYAERSGALILAEGIETEPHLANALAFGATLGQGWKYGRPTSTPSTSTPRAALTLRPAEANPCGDRATSPFSTLPDDVVRHRSPKRLLIELSKQLEREALRLGETCVVAATFQEARHFTPSTKARYRRLAEETGFVCALGRGLPIEPLPGVRGSTLADDDPALGEWDLVVISPHFCTALLARDLGDEGPDLDRMFEYALTYRRDTVVRAAQSLLSRVQAVGG